jgi:hypothetical protein
MTTSGMARLGPFCDEDPACEGREDMEVLDDTGPILVLSTFSLIFRFGCVRTGELGRSVYLGFFDGEGPDMASGSGDSKSSGAIEVEASVLAILGVVLAETGVALTG